VHAESSGSTISLASAGTAAAPVQILCGNDVAEPPTALTTSAGITCTGGGDFDVTGHSDVYGVAFVAAAGAAGFSFQQIAVSWGWRLEACALTISNTTSTSRISFQSRGSSARDGKIELINTNISFGEATQAILLGGPFEWRGGTLTAAPNTGGLFVVSAGGTADAHLVGVDLSALGSRALLGVTVGGPGGIVKIENCKLGSGWTATTGTFPGPGQAQVWVDHSTDGDTHYTIYRAQYEGVLSQETVQVRTGGASDGTTPLAWRMDATAGAQFLRPLYSPEMVAWNNTTGAAKTVTVEILHDSVTNLQDDEVWLEVEYQGTSGFTQSAFASDRMTTLLSTPADQTASAATWTTTGMTNPNKQKLEVTVTPQEIGFLRVRVAVAKDYTIVVDPMLVVS
jgi:hypothetical protein